ncbi:MAG TPA: hypothetical protein ENK56_00430 [Chloroflexi bacterium]|nr:hypothetical protein [Chloroflexota bacterium]
MEVWQKVLVDPEFLEDVHSEPGCIACHGGTPDTDDKEAAHQGLLPKAGQEPERACGTCHVGLVRQAREGLHRMLWGYQAVLEARGADFTDPATVRAYQTHCIGCHADCGDCHVSRPRALEGGLIAGHKVKRVASVFTTCGGCHSARINDEYKGKHEGIPADVHWEREGMPCTRCHTLEEYHYGGHGTRYAGAPRPSCTESGCHDTVRVGDGITQHDETHLEGLDCQVCHAAGPYKSCFNCHVGRDDKGLPYFTSDPSALTFKIGRNPVKSPERPWNYVLLRHVPTTADLFGYYGEDLLPGYDNLPTWKYTTPHNTRRITPQNERCNACHGQTALFLTEADVAPEERAANRDVIVTEVPEPVEEEVQP